MRLRARIDSNVSSCSWPVPVPEFVQTRHESEQVFSERMAASTAIKVRFGEQSLRLNHPSCLTFDSLQKACLEGFEGVSLDSPLSLWYLDDDGDKCIVCSDETFKGAIEFASNSTDAASKREKAQLTLHVPTERSGTGSDPALLAAAEPKVAVPKGAFLSPISVQLYADGKSRGVRMLPTGNVRCTLTSLVRILDIVNGLPQSLL